MRITGGNLRGRVLKGPGPAAIRPTSDRLRETIFNILIHAYGNPLEGARVIDLYAGIGAMGIEALSRGAAFALLIDKSAQACAIIRANACALDLAGKTAIQKRDARTLGIAPEGERFTLAFLDPPYGRGFVLPTLAALGGGAWLAKDALVVIEEQARASFELPAGFTALDMRRQSDTQVIFALFN